MKAASRARSSNIRVINRRPCCLDRWLLGAITHEEGNQASDETLTQGLTGGFISNLADARRPELRQRVAARGRSLGRTRVAPEGFVLTGALHCRFRALHDRLGVSTS